MKAYPIPDPLPDGLRCFFIAIPDDDLFLWQFMGAYRFFGTWVAWERDAAKRGKDAAALWRNAIEWTEEHMTCEFPDYSEIFEQWPFEGMASSLALIAQRLEALEASQSQSQAISIYNDCCSCGGDVPLPGWDGDNDGTGGGPTDDPPGWDSGVNGDYEDYKCKAANKLVADYVATLSGITGVSSLIGIMGAVAAAALMNTSALSGLIVGLMGLGLSAAGAVVLLLGTFVTMILAGEAVVLLIGDVALGLNKQELVCLLYDSSDTEQAKAAFTAVTAAALADVEAGEHAGLLSEFFARLLTVIVPESTMGVLFNYDADVAEHESEYDCECLEPLLISDDFSTNTLLTKWAVSRFSWLNEAAEGNARDTDVAYMRQTYDTWLANGAPVGVCASMSISFTYKKLEDSGGTRFLILSAKNSLDAMQTVVILYPSDMVLNEEYSFSTIIPFTVNINSAAGQPILSFLLQTNSSRVRIAIDNVVIRGVVE